jgi:glycosyltransferase involved in cell wall biosynthesis
MPLVSVLTAAVGEWAEFVAEAGESVAGQALPAGWELEWVVQEDGAAPSLAETVERWGFARYQANREQLGIAATRNVGLTRAGGSLVFMLDCDDLLLPGGLAAVVRPFTEHPEIHWVATQADNLEADGTRTSFEPLWEPGYRAAGAVNDYIVDSGRVPFLPMGMGFRLATVRALGGWLATPNGEDSGLVAAITELAPGFYTPETVWLYRQHERQTSRRADWQARLPVSLDIVRQRIRAVREVGLGIG